MRPDPILLLFAWFILPMPLVVYQERTMIAQIILCQIKAVKIAQQAEQKFNLGNDEDEDNDEIFRDFLVARWLDPCNTTANAYLSFLYPCPVLLSHQNGDRIVGNQFTLVGQANPNIAVLCRISTCLALFGGLIPVSEETTLQREVMTDDNGNFEINVSLSSAKPSGTRYKVFVIASSDREMVTGTQITLIQR